jgi:hypothetical protein
VLVVVRGGGKVQSRANIFRRRQIPSAKGFNQEFSFSIEPNSVINDLPLLKDQFLNTVPQQLDV